MIARPKLLASLHDVSPLTLDASRDAVDLIHAAGIPSSALTVLVVPFHEASVALDAHEPTLEFLRQLARDGATLVAHGYTHRMTKARQSILRWFTTRWFARGQGELALCDAAETTRKLDAADAIFARAKLPLFGFVPPAWLLSREAAEAVAARGFAFVERMGGIFTDAHPVAARRLVGWGSLSAIEAVATSMWAWIQARRAPADTRVAIHPPDVQRRRTRRSLERTLARLVGKLEPISYRGYLAERAAPAALEPARVPSRPS